MVHPLIKRVMDAHEELQAISKEMSRIERDSPFYMHLALDSVNAAIKALRVCPAPEIDPITLEVTR